jgi:hypothetical protein
VDPAERFQSAAEFRAALERAVRQPDQAAAERPSRSLAVTQKTAPADLHHLPAAPTFGRARHLPAPAPAHAATPTHLGFAGFSMLFFCFPLGLVGVVYALKARAKSDLHDLAGARSSASSGLTWSWLACGAGSVGWWYLLHQLVHVLK